ncbi:MAG: RNA-binding cell elongation regulator Jag/EloR [Dehalococcoidia bacterium]|nr:RNA-binding cell elongation regulator Jag/EloR [Dehalococcoidia bacterium]
MPELSYDDFVGQKESTDKSEETGEAPQASEGDATGNRQGRGRRGQRRTDRDGDRARNRPEVQVEPNIDAEEVDMAATIVDDMLRILDIDADISLREPVSPGDGKGAALAVIDISGDELGALIGRRGETLAAMQYLVNLILAKRYPQSAGVTIDIEHYRHRREEQLTSLAQRMADRVKQHGTSITLEPMPAAERRLVHLALADDEEIVTNSSGEGENRKVVISPRD